MTDYTTLLLVCASCLGWLVSIGIYFGRYQAVKKRDPKIVWMLEVKQAATLLLASGLAVSPWAITHEVPVTLTVIISMILYHTYKAVFFLNRHRSPRFPLIKKALYLSLFILRELSVSIVCIWVYYTYIKYSSNCRTLEELLMMPGIEMFRFVLMLPLVAAFATTIFTVPDLLRPSCNQHLNKHMAHLDNVFISLVRIRAFLTFFHLVLLVYILHDPLDSNIQYVAWLFLLSLALLDTFLTIVNTRKLKFCNQGGDSDDLT